MPSDLTTVINSAVADANGAGLDYVDETEHAVRAVMRVRPDMDAPEALAVVDRFRANEERVT